MRICLHNITSPVLIVELEHVGVFYYNQTAGVGCFQREVEGVAVPLCTLNSKWCDPTEWYLTDRTVGSSINEILSDLNHWGTVESFTNFEWNRHGTNEEAWVSLKFEYNGAEFKGILTWENCD